MQKYRHRYCAAETMMKIGLVGSVLLAVALSGCGGGGGGSSDGTGSVGGDGGSSVNVPGVTFTSITVNSPPVVSFVVNDSAGKPVTGLTLYDASSSTGCGSSNVSFAIAKFGGANWQSLISRQRYASDSPGKLSVIEGTTDPKPASGYANPDTALTDPSTRIVGILEEANGIYTYHFAIDVTTPLLMADAVDKRNVSLGKVANDGHVAVKDGMTLHRVVLQLCYVDPVSHETVKVNPYIDFTLGPDGKGVIYRDSKGNPVPARKVVARESCNDCHVNFAQHGGNRVDPNFCVVCHNPGSRDFETGNPIDFKLMVHKFHMGKRLTQDYAVRSAVARKDMGGGVIEGMLYPQDQRNCAKCHDGSAGAAHMTPQGDNWKTKASKNACWACHDDYKDPGSGWQTAHAQFASLSFFSPSVANPDDTPDSTCQSCHNDTGPGTVPSNAEAHQVPEWQMSENYAFNIWDITRNANNTLTVEYSVSNPKTGSDYDMLDPTLTARFSSLSLLFGWNSTDYANDGGPGRGQPLSAKVTTDASVQRVGSSNRFRLTSGVLPAAANGTVAVAFQGRINDSGLRVPVPNLVKYFAMSGNAVERRQVVSAEKCNNCHGRFLGYASLTSFTPGLGAHGANRNDPQVCVICHNGNNPLPGTVVSGGKVTQYAESADFKQMIHKMHEDLGDGYPVWPGGVVTTAQNSTIQAGMKYCNLCHVDKSYVVGSSILGTSVTYDVDTSVDSTDATVTDTNALDNLVISPKASACYSCHASEEAKNHMIQIGGAAFGTVTQGDVMSGAKVFETCDACHQSGAMEPVDAVHASVGQ
jgi:OmcA/MtrC family decaheme c-type cytochrome